MRFESSVEVKLGISFSSTMFCCMQMDLKFWCGWDQQTMEINVVDTDVTSSSEIIHWVYKYPVSQILLAILTCMNFTLPNQLWLADLISRSFWCVGNGTVQIMLEILLCDQL